MPRVSIIMAAYNCEKTLSQAVDSILQQSFQDWEFIICDDASTDNTYKMLHEYAERQPQKFIILHNDQNSKLPFSLNRCLEVANGELIARMDADDISYPERLAKQVAFLDEHPDLQVVGTSMEQFGNASQGIIHAVMNPNRYTLLTKPPFHHATILMRKSAYDAIHGYTVSKRTVRGQDVDLWFRFYQQGFEGGNLDEVLYLVREDTNAVRRRKLSASWQITKTNWIGFRRLHYPWYQYWRIFKPLISWFTPRWIKKLNRKPQKTVPFRGNHG